jgi:membrane protease YdiL (CAAX protease family)
VYLYFGYLLVQTCALLMKIIQSNIAMPAIFLSIIVVLIWSFIPFVGYWLARLLNAKGQASKYVLLSFGIGIGFIEQGLFYFDLLANKQNMIGTFIVFILFFMVAYISTNKTESCR